MVFGIGSPLASHIKGYTTFQLNSKSNSAAAVAMYYSSKSDNNRVTNLP